ncbi:Rossmann-fold NAD(P)-binding domain-containing protein [Galactobacter caseinivorans]|uniref:Reductase n=1 Tax=Galactobacter caseinivorans TaxID=2676123 RepID=A0A496PM29_9MICC|nr:reductase [Galactobacter caseinivorans]RKW71598.1 reductase [Galactobacter caseinivorans]
MKRVLILGGTAWLGAEIAAAHRDRGAEVVCLARGESGAAPDGVRLVQGDRLDPHTYGLVPGEWDEVVELAYQPELVRPALEALGERAAHWTLVSSVSVYADSTTAGADEAAQLVVPADLAQYPDAKVAAEQASLAGLGDRLLIARPGLIVGPGDPSDRAGYWLARLSRGGRVVAPTFHERWVQLIDVADLASWIATAGGAGSTGSVNAVGEVHTMEQFFGQVRAVTGFSGEMVHLDDESLVGLGVNYWSGPRSLPLWIPMSEAGFMQRDGSAFRRQDGSPRSLTQTLERMLDDEVARGVSRERRAGLSPQTEAAILAAAGR